jgi:hypothetical protein
LLAGAAAAIVSQRAGTCQGSLPPPTTYRPHTPHVDAEAVPEAA